MYEKRMFFSANSSNQYVDFGHLRNLNYVDLRVLAKKCLTGMYFIKRKEVSKFIESEEGKKKSLAGNV